jgi:pimeloyl-ACP methyl ester carboxylesterase
MPTTAFADIETIRLDRRNLLGRSAAGIAIPAALVVAGLPVRTAATQSAGDAAATPAAEGEEMTDPPRAGYAPVNGLQMYYEIHGKGEPLLLLHGAFGTIELWGPILATLTENHQVIAVEFQGHGRTADIERPLTYEQLVEDTAALMRYLDIEQADIVGYSMGGNVALGLAIEHPGLVRKLAVAGANYNNDGLYPESLAAIESLTPEMFAGSPPEAANRFHKSSCPPEPV